MSSNTFLCYVWLDVYNSKQYGPGTNFCGTDVDQLAKPTFRSRYDHPPDSVWKGLTEHRRNYSV